MLACSGALATGLTSQRGNLVAQVHDTDIEHDWTTKRVQLFIPKKGNRYLSAPGPGPGNLIPILNEKGIGIVSFGRQTPVFTPYPGTPKHITQDELMSVSNSAREFVNLWSENMTQYGTPELGGYIARLLVDTEEGYHIEGANWVYGDPANHAIHGPMTDQVYACANFFVNARLKKHAEAGVGSGYARAKRIWELLIDRQYECVIDEAWEDPVIDLIPGAGGGITLQYFMSIFRDHGNLSPEEGRMGSYVPEERGKKTVCCHGVQVYTRCVTICNPVENHTDLFSCLWMAFGQPCSSPFLPIFIGVNSVPDAMSEEANPVARVFEDLRLALEYHPEYRDKVKYYWTVFELQTIEEGYNVEKEATKLAEEGNLTAARTLLTEFVYKKCDESSSKGKQWVEKLQSLPLLP